MDGEVGALLEERRSEGKGGWKQRRKGGWKTRWRGSWEEKGGIS